METTYKTDGKLLADRTIQRIFWDHVKAVVVIAASVTVIGGGTLAAHAVGKGVDGKGADEVGAAGATPGGGGSVLADYDPTSQPGFKGPEVLSGPDEPNIPGGAFKLEKYAFCQTTGNFVDGSRESCMSQNYSECVWWMDDDLVLFGDNIMNTVMALEGDRLHRLAGSGVRGDKDGPAECAEFSFGVYVSAHPGLVRTKTGDFFISDNHNGKIKKIFKKPDGRWWVQTVAGGGGRNLKVGETCDNPLDVSLALYLSYGRAGLTLIGPGKDHLYITAGDNNSPRSYLMYPDGKLKCLRSGGTGDLPTGLPPQKGFSYGWRGGNMVSCWKTSRAGDTSVKVAGFDDAEIKAKEAAGWKKVLDGPVDDCTFWFTSGLLRPDGRAIYTIGGDESVIRRIMNGRVTSLDLKTGKWIESRHQYLQKLACMRPSRLTWDGYFYLTYAFGGVGMYRARLYDPLKKPDEIREGGRP